MNIAAIKLGDAKRFLDLLTLLDNETDTMLHMANERMRIAENIRVQIHEKKKTPLVFGMTKTKLLREYTFFVYQV